MVGPRANEDEDVGIGVAAAGVVEFVVRTDGCGLCRNEDFAGARSHGNAADVAQIDCVGADPNTVDGMFGVEAPLLYDRFVEEPCARGVQGNAVAKVVSLLGDFRFVRFWVEVGCVEGIEDVDEPSGVRVEHGGNGIAAVTERKVGLKLGLWCEGIPGATVVG